METEIDAGFISRTYRAAALVWAVVTGVALVFGHWAVAAGWTVGCLLSFGVFWSLQWAVRRNFVPGNLGAKGTLTRFYLVKMIVIGLLLALAVAVGGRNFAFVVALCCGVLLVQMVIVARAVGAAISGNRSESEG